MTHWKRDADALGIEYDEDGVLPKPVQCDRCLGYGHKAKHCPVRSAAPMLRRLDNARHRIPFWWWLTYDALVALVIVVGISPSAPAFWLGFAVLAIAVAIDTVEFIVKRPSARARLNASE